MTRVVFVTKDFIATRCNDEVYVTWLMLMIYLIHSQKNTHIISHIRYVVLTQNINEKQLFQVKEFGKNSLINSIPFIIKTENFQCQKSVDFSGTF